MKKSRKNLLAAVAMVLVFAFIFTAAPLSFSAADDYKVYNHLKYRIIKNDYVVITGYVEGIDKNLVIPKKIEGYSVTKIGYEAFRNCTSLASVTIPDSVTEIEHSAFSDCASLTDLTIGKSVTSIKGRAFAGCVNLERITVAAGNTSFEVKGETLVEKGTGKVITTTKTRCLRYRRA